MTQRPVDERPRTEPEIIPPGESVRRRGDARGPFEGTHRVYVARVGPFGFAMFMAALAILAALVFLTLLGAFVILIPVAGLLLALAVGISLLRGPFRRL